MTRIDIPATPSTEFYSADQDQGNAFTSDDPVALFGEWMALAAKSEPNDVNAMSLATVDGDGTPNVRIVLLKGASDAGFDLYSNTESDKGREMAANPRVALCFHWKTIRRQVRVRGAVSQLPDAEIDGYFRQRARGSRIGAWASQQSRPIGSRAELEAALAETEKRFDGVEDVPRPDYWVGWRLVPTAIEFWVNQPYRLHDRLLFTRETPDAAWETTRLFP